jgi:electron transport complex protein RnfG
VTEGIKLTAALVIVTTVAGLAIALTWQNTTARIEAQKTKARLQALKTVVPANDTIIEHNNGHAPLPSRYWEARTNAQTVGYVFEAQKQGYSSAIKLMVGVDTTGTITGLTVMEQGETPGLGTRVQEVALTAYIWNFFTASSAEQAPWFCQQFNGIDVTRPVTISKAGEWHALDSQQRDELLEQNAISALTGATISTRAVTAAVETQITAYFNALQTRE